MNGRSTFQRLEYLFHELDGLPLVERERLLDELAARDPNIHAQLLSMLKAGGTKAGALDRVAETSQALLSDGTLPDSIGPYRISGLLGQGGMGRVYAAEQSEPVQRQVALKVARNAHLSDAARTRFLAERQALAVLDHPDIAKVFDAGSTDTGQLWFAMEMVRGDPITQWASEHDLTLRQRIELFVPVCEAVQHAHQKGLIHRDLKPSNLLVVDQDGSPRVRVIDFGIAKALESGADAPPAATRVGDVVGTPEYMSPEQASLGEVDIDTRSDVYALGLVLHELLTGRLPIAPDTLQDASFGELCRRVREDPIIAPSRLAPSPSDAVDRKALRGDLDLVVLKALAKDREQRYASPLALADDLRRVLDCQPVAAAPPGPGYRMRKFVRRHRLPVTLAATASIGLVLLTAVAWRQADLAADERDRARMEAQRSAATLSFLRDMLASADPAQAQGQDLTVRELVDRARNALPEAQLDLQARAAVEETLATTYNSLGRPEDGLPLAQAASERLRQALGPDDPLTLSAQHAEARFYVYLGQFEEAIELLESTLAGRERVLGVHMDTASTLHNLAYAWAELGEIERALAMDRRQLELVEQLAGPESEEALVTLSSVAHGLTMLERHDEAIELFERILAGYRQHLGLRHPNTLSVLHNLAYLARRQGETELAEQRYLDVIEQRRQVLGSTHLQTLNSIANLGALYLEDGRLERARPMLEEAARSRVEVLGPEHPDSLASRLDRLRLEAASGASADWLPEAEQLEQLTRSLLGPDDALTELAAGLRSDLAKASAEAR
jgi:serine/threonine protein kinase/tetratricopeptide (TPR) repeat protein